METIHVETPSMAALSGAKGVGESGTIATYPCVFNALNDGIFHVGLKIELNTAPAFPEDIANALHSANPSAKF